MDAGEYWLLDSVVESRDSLAMLVSKDIETAFNKRSHGLTRDQLINVLDRLFLRGDLLAQRMEKLVQRNSSFRLARKLKRLSAVGYVAFTDSLHRAEPDGKRFHSRTGNDISTIRFMRSREREK